MKWIIVNLFQDPGIRKTKHDVRTTVDVDNIESVEQVQRQVSRNNQLVAEMTTEINMKDGIIIECTDAFKDVVAAILLANSMENKRRKDGDVFCAVVIDVQKIFEGGAKVAVEDEQVAEDEAPMALFQVGDVITLRDFDFVTDALSGLTHTAPRYTVTDVLHERIMLVCHAQNTPCCIFRHEQCKYKVVQKGKSNVR